MILIVHNEKKIITRIIECNKDRVNTVVEQLNLEHYHTYEKTNAYVGLSMDYLLDNGLIKSNKQLLKEKLITLEEDEILEDNKIRKLTLQEQVTKGILTLADNEEIRGETVVTLSDDEMKQKFPERYTEEETTGSSDKTVNQEVFKKDNEIRTLKDQYLDADLDDNEALKMDLKKQIQEAKKELEILQSELTTEPTENNNE